MGVSDKWGEEMRPIDADALIDNMVDYVVDGYAESPIDFESYTKMVQTAPTIDAVSVVRCKECKWAKANGTYQWCGRLDSTARITADDYCSYGERKESE